MTIMWKQREKLNLKVGDKAYFFSDFGDIVPHLVTIEGDCEEGTGYSAFDPKWETRDENDVYTVTGGSIHTCNGSLFKTKREARAEVVRLANKYRKEWAEKQAKACRVIQWLDYLLATGGRW
jgi:hypothetical protein